MQDWIQQEVKELQLEQEAFGEEGRIPFWSAPQGETKIEVDITHEPFETKFKGKKVLHLFIEGEPKLWSVSTKSPLWRELITHLATGKKVFKLIRVGTDAKNTRYSLVVV